MKADETKIRQCLLNLLSNANKFTHGGVISLQVEGDTVNDETWVVFTVTDTGDGIDANDIDIIFDEYGQTQKAKSRSDSTGLGLPICKKFSQLLGGDVTVSSVLGKGSTFVIKIPRYSTY
ncbi:MAG: hypothetical protein HON94_15645 [Methylococcales bacterium]|jgi:two-component system, sensor histidine kinase and response regulator|nr:hypothetical protein [Methylococcales bacterium]